MNEKRPATLVRVAVPADEPALASLDATAWTPESGFPSVQQGPYAPFFSEDSPAGAHLVAEMGGEVVGYIRLKPATRLIENAHVVLINGLAVAPAARGRGVASALIAAAEQAACARGARKLSLRVLGSNAPARRLYQRSGFEIEGTLRDEFCVNGRYVDDLIMAKRLAR